MLISQPPLQCTQVSIGRFHHFHLARQLEKHQLLDSIYTGYPLWKLFDEEGIPLSKIRTFPWVQTPYMGRGKLALDRWVWLNRLWAWFAQDTLDRHVAAQLTERGILIALSGSGLHSGRRMQQLGGYHICDRGSVHISIQNQLLQDEYKRYGLLWEGIDPRMLEKELAEYEQANFISVPSQFCFYSFVNHGFSKTKLLKFPYGARLSRFKQADTCNLLPTREQFLVLFVGHAGVQKGFIDLLAAYRLLRHPNKRLLLIGTLSSPAKDLLNSCNLEGIKHLGIVPNAQLRDYYNQASVFVLPSIQEGLAMVIGEAMACGCPVIASTNTGASELITDGKEGFIVPIRRPDMIADRMQQLADDFQLGQRMRLSSIARMQHLQGWNRYGEMWAHFLRTFICSEQSKKPATG
jgi:glycosyltransferase involved in cell wall biosynthesis